MAEPSSPVALIYKELFDRYEELKNLGKWLGGKPRVVVAGQSPSAPGQLYRALLGEPEAEVEQTDADAGTWQAVASYKLDDVPGLGAVGVAGEAEQALSYLREADVVLLAMPVDQRPTMLEQGLWDHLKRLKRVRLVVVCAPRPADGDTVTTPELDKEAWSLWAREIQRVLGDSGAEVLPSRYLAEDDMVAVARAIVKSEALSGEAKAALPSLIKHAGARDALVLDQVKKTAGTAAWLGLSPIPFSDVAAITPLQVILVCRVAAAYGRIITPAQAKEFIAAAIPVAAAGFGFRLAFRKIAGGLAEGLLPLRLGVGAGMAWLGTQAVGRAAQHYFREAAQLSPAEAGRRAQEELAHELKPGNPFVSKSAPAKSGPEA
ncbi:MAG: hypothetical protein HZB16_16985 [Armatimonadetes bacterium]|nr:hypothetical protein [Armatimonadota bacterium]